ncbi:acyltransferase family protein [Pantoea allii]|uniref:Acyltransferase n=1 Tax=Pantoea allii TaxID=574096 RepID=A0A2V2BPK1_9GAMM|nr:MULTISPECIES: acyltransferase [Pantoea]MBW1212576.1 acyltransferase [Pantoea allii]MBW1255786.1 acyltransferase [Pantoea allii]MBW1264863.1 acyltransferase [Pantoea allii]MBW1286980.1 acyltransferase [Pantoea allii]MDJ0038907.1 acyltransferase [Pantoea allii]
MSATRGWSTELEGLRGIASLWVLLGHISLLIHCHITLISSPGIGVDLFILLSGYLMAKNYVERQHKEPWQSAETIKKFWLRRFFRIAPLYYLLLAVALIYGPWFGEMRDTIAQFYSGTATESSRYADQSLMNVLTHLSFLFGLLPAYGFNTTLPDWSIGLEMQFYLLFPFIMLAVMRFGYATALLSIMALSCAGRYLLPDYYEAFEMPSMILIKLNMFISGMLLAEAVRRKSLLYIVFALAGPAVSVLIGLGAIKLQVMLEAVMIIGMAAVLWQYQENSLMAKLIQIPRKLLNNRLSTWLGDVSFSVYLLHLLIVIPAIALLLNQTDIEYQHDLTRFLIVCAVSIPLTYGLASLLFKYVEKPGINLGKRFLSAKPAR